MPGGELPISDKAIIQIVLCLAYVPICLIVYRRLFPYLTTVAKRLATGFLAAQVVVIMLFLEYRPNSEFEKWLLHPDLEWNIPSALSSMQLALVGCVAMLTASCSRFKRYWQRFHLLALGLFILYVGMGEFFSWKSSSADWKQQYVIIGALVAALTLVIAVSSPKSERIWFICLFTGLAFIATSAVLIDEIPRLCGGIGQLRFYGCIRVYVIEEALEFLGSWLTLVAMLGEFSVTAPRPTQRIRLSLYSMPLIWIVFISIFSPSNTIEVSSPDTPASVEFSSRVHLYGYRETEEGIPASIILRLPADSDSSGTGFSIHLLDQVSGDSVASYDDFVDRKDIVWPKRRGFVPLYRQAIDLAITSQVPTNNAFFVVLSLWRYNDGSYARQQIVASDLELIGDTQLLLGELIIPSSPTASPRAPLAAFDNGFALDTIALPERARPGDALSVSFTWRSDVASQEDTVQFLHFGHVETGAWFVYDQQPLGPRLPTRLWYRGLTDTETWRVLLPADLAPGLYQVFTGLYRTRDQERVPATDADGARFVDARVPLGNLIIGTS